MCFVHQSGSSAGSERRLLWKSVIDLILIWSNHCALTFWHRLYSLSLSLSLTQKSAQKYIFSFKSGRHVFFCVEIFFQLSESNISRGCIACWTSLCKGSNLQWMIIFLVTLPSQAFMLSTPWTVKQGLCCSAAFEFFGVASKFKVSFQSRLAGLSVTFSFHLQNAWAAFKTLM